MKRDYNFKFCPVCGKDLKTETIKKSEPARLICSACRYIFYQDPKLVSCAIIEIDKKIVLLKRGINPGKGKWVVPGGYVDRGETVESAAVRETLEECGLTIKLKELIGLYSYPGTTEALAFFKAEYISGDLKADDESIEAKLFKKDNIPWDDLAFQSTKDALRDYIKGVIIK